MSEELKPCPFCGKEPSTWKHATLDNARTWKTVQCWHHGDVFPEFTGAEWNSSWAHEQIEALEAEIKKTHERMVSSQPYYYEEWKKVSDLCRRMGEALEKTLAALVSYKNHVPEPYKQNPIYIIGAHEAEKEAIEILRQWQEQQGVSNGML